MRFCLIPEHSRSNIIFERKIATTISPTQCLYGYAKIFFETNGICYVPAIQTKTLRHLIMSIALYYLVQTNIRCRKFCVVNFFNTGCIFLSGIKIIRAAEIIFGAGADDFAVIAGFSVRHGNFDPVLICAFDDVVIRNDIAVLGDDHQRRRGSGHIVSDTPTATTSLDGLGTGIERTDPVQILTMTCLISV